VSSTGTPRPPVAWHHAATGLEDFAIVTFRVEADALARHLPAGIEPRTFAFADGRTGSLVSAVAFVDRDFHFRFCLPVRVSCGQINHRAYVVRRGVAGVWFFRTTLDHPTVHVPRLLWGMPWRRGRIRIEAGWEGGGAHWSLRSADAAGTSSCRAVEAPPPARLDGFAGPDEWREVLTHPMVGWYRRSRGRVGRYGVWHPAMEPRHLRADHARFHHFEALGLVAPGARPHSVLAQERLHFDVHTPPRLERR
jgi:hypothetical protein